MTDRQMIVYFFYANDMSHGVQPGHFGSKFKTVNKNTWYCQTACHSQGPVINCPWAYILIFIAYVTQIRPFPDGIPYC